jgi:hypothetical protein
MSGSSAPAAAGRSAWTSLAGRSPCPHLGHLIIYMYSHTVQIREYKMKVHLAKNVQYLYAAVLRRVKPAIIIICLKSRKQKFVHSQMGCGWRMLYLC